MLKSVDLLKAALVLLTAIKMEVTKVAFFIWGALF